MSVGAFEKKFVVSGISDGIRMDGRSLRSPRSITIRANTVDLSPGSVTVSYGDCCVTAGMRMDLQKPAPERADEGIVDFYVSMTSVSDRVDPELLRK
uniref:Ribosomal RNA-processing protein 42 n=1 Tax=Trichuris muris TaxID=70415 RepID=A0A5S6Q8Q1_TRIMR